MTTVELQEHARANGLKYFQSDKPCRHGHVALRFTSNRACTECSKNHSSKWYGNPQNKDKISQKCKKYRVENLQRAKERNALWERNHRLERNEFKREWRARNSDHFKKYQKEWRRINAIKISNYNNRRRALIRGNGGNYTPQDIDDIKKMQRSKCACCRVSLSSGYHIDHIKALKNGGSNDRKNIQLLCQHCNSVKSAKDSIDFMREQGRLL